jgi:hypothetical protein
MLKRSLHGIDLAEDLLVSCKNKIPYATDIHRNQSLSFLDILQSTFECLLTFSLASHGLSQGSKSGRGARCALPRHRWSEAPMPIRFLSSYLDGCLTYFIRTTSRSKMHQTQIEEQYCTLTPGMIRR